MKKEELVKIIEESIQLAEEGKSKLNEKILNLEGFSSRKVRHFLNNIVNLRGPDCRYLEVGTWKGSTFVSAMHKNNNSHGIAVEIFDWPEEIKNAFDENTNRYLDKNWELKNIDFKEIGKIEDKINVYFFDGPHERENQCKAFTVMNDNLQNLFIAIVDDWNWPHVKNGTRDAFEELKYNVVKEWEMPSSGKYPGDPDQWWNGFYIAVIEK